MFMSRRDAYRTKRGEFMPMLATVVRQSKGVYCAFIVFAKSKREYAQEIIRAKNKREALRLLRKDYPHVKVRK
jgi:hypothetical protein